jgi:uroporphyrin-III C-methyltransferase
LRREVLATHPRGEERRLLLHELAHRPLCDSPTCATRLLARAPLPLAQVYLVGAGPGDPDLLTVKAVRLIQSADVVLHDDLVPQAILDLAARAEIVNVGKRCGTKRITQNEINQMMIEYAQAGRAVIRLKCGDPLIFGRAAEEMEALSEAGIGFEVVPGITSALAAAASIPASLTDRRAASNVIFSTGHHAQSHNEAALPSIEDATRVVYMPGRDLTLLADQWLTEGLPPDFPCVLVSRAAQPDQQVRHTTLEALGSERGMQAPSLLLAGWAVGRLSTEALEAGIEASLRD